VGLPRARASKSKDCRSNTVKDFGDHILHLAGVDVLLSALFVVAGGEIEAVDEMFVRVGDSDFRII